MKQDKITIVIFSIALLILMLMSFVVYGLRGTTAEADTTMGFEVIDKSFGVTLIVYDVETGVMYALSHGAYNAGSMTLMVNPDGTPRVYEGFSGK